MSISPASPFRPVSIDSRIRSMPSGAGLLISRTPSIVTDGSWMLSLARDDIASIHSFPTPRELSALVTDHNVQRIVDRQSDPILKKHIGVCGCHICDGNIRLAYIGDNLVQDGSWFLLIHAPNAVYPHLILILGVDLRYSFLDDQFVDIIKVHVSEPGLERVLLLELNGTCQFHQAPLVIGD